MDGAAVVMETSRRGNSLFFFFSRQTVSQTGVGLLSVNMRGVCWYEMAATTPTHRNGTGRIQYGALKQVTLRKEEKLLKRELKIFKAIYNFSRQKNSRVKKE